MSDPRNGRHRAQGDALVEAHILIALQREVWAAKGLPGEARLRRPVVVTDIETMGLAIDDPIVEIAAVCVLPDLTIAPETFHTYIHTPGLTRAAWDASFVANNSSMEFGDMDGAPTRHGACALLRQYHPRDLWTSYNRAFDMPRLDHHCGFQPELAPCLMEATPQTFRVVCRETRCAQFWPGHFARPRMSADLAVQVLRERGHEIPEWASE